MGPMQLQTELLNVQRRLAKDRREVRTLPKGTFSHIIKNGSVFYTLYEKKTLKGITKDKGLVSKLMRRDFLLERIARNEKQEEVLMYAIKHLRPTDSASIIQALSVSHPGISWSTCFTSSELSEWEKADYETNDLYRGNKVHVTGNGVFTRSKDEKEIGNMLEEKRIAYRYEWMQYSMGRKFAPDFAIKRESDGKIVFWEHFGMISDEGYRKNTYEKIVFFESCGLHLWDNFIISFADRSGSLDTKKIDRLCELFLR